MSFPRLIAAAIGLVLPLATIGAAQAASHAATAPHRAHHPARVSTATYHPAHKAKVRRFRTAQTSRDAHRHANLTRGS